MRASYYTDKLLPVYCAAYYDLQAQSDELRSHLPREQRYSWFLVEDNDPSHGTRNKESLPAKYKQHDKMRCLPHPANSPDLNPIEGILSIIKERVRRQLDEINSIAELRQRLQTEWKTVSMEQIRARIMEMQYRCGQAWADPTARVKTDL